ncbi:MAG: hypothetical protein Q9166_003801 [cf. Caloplaca sp. 2 TL-2023]
MTALSPEDIRILEQTRQRLSQLTESLNSLNRDVHSPHPLPSWTSLTSRFSILAQNLSSLGAHLSTHASVLNSLSVFPLPNYPAREYENVLLQLLRKKLEPGVEEWVEEGYKRGKDVVGREGVMAGGLRGEGEMGKERGMGAKGEMDEEKWKELWAWCPVRANEEAMGYEWLTGKWTREEREEGMNGEDEDEEDEGEEDGTEGQKEEGMGGLGGEGALGRAVRMEDVLRFMSTGVEPR